MKTDTNRGQSRLEVRLGSEEGSSFRVQTLGGELVVDERRAKILDGHIDTFEKVAAIAGINGRQSFYLLGPGQEMNELHAGKFFFKGPFSVLKRSTKSDEARALWKDFGKQREKTGRSAEEASGLEAEAAAHQKR